jgi:hypothetical protein
VNLRRAVENILKAAAFTIVYLILVTFVFPLVSNLASGQSLSVLFENSITVFYIFSVLAALASGTILQAPLDFAKTLVPVVFTLLAYENPVLTIKPQQAATSAILSVQIDIGSLLILLLLLDLILLAKGVLQLLTFVNRRVA